jgi:hypothetical protein
VTHRKLSKLPDGEKKKEVRNVRNWLINTCKIPAKDVRGWRSPYLADDDKVRKYIEEAGYQYDTSMPEFFNSNTSPSPGRRVWPHTLDKGIQMTKACRYFGNINNCQSNEKHNLYEIPMWMYQSRSHKPSSKGLMDPPNAYKILKAELHRNYKSHRAPIGIWTHSTSTGYLNKAYVLLLIIRKQKRLLTKCRTKSSLSFSTSNYGCYNVLMLHLFCSEPRRQISKFLQYALKNKNVWVVTPSQLLDWMENPVPASKMKSFMSKYKCS